MATSACLASSCATRTSSAASSRRPALFEAPAGAAEIDGQRDQPRLRAVVEVALDLPAVARRRGHGEVTLLGEALGGLLELASRGPKEAAHDRFVNREYAADDPGRQEEEQQPAAGDPDPFDRGVELVAVPKDVPAVLWRDGEIPDRRRDGPERDRPADHRDEEEHEPEGEEQHQVEDFAPGAEVDQRLQPVAPLGPVVGPLRPIRDGLREEEAGMEPFDSRADAREHERAHEQRDPEQEERAHADHEQGQEHGEPDDPRREADQGVRGLLPRPEAEGLGEEAVERSLRPLYARATRGTMALPGVLLLVRALPREGGARAGARRRSGRRTRCRSGSRSSRCRPSSTRG